MFEERLLFLLKRRNSFLNITIMIRLLVFFGAFLISGCTESISDGLPGNHFHTSSNWVSGDTEHDEGFINNAENCKACHGENLDGGQSGVSCLDCHHSWTLNEIIKDHGQGFVNQASVCKGCHGQDLEGGLRSILCDLSSWLGRAVRSSAWD